MKRLITAITWLAATLVPDATPAQQVKITGTSTAQLIQLRPLVTDSIAAGDAIGEGLIRRTAEGHLVRCVTGERVCRFTRSGDVATVAPVIQDVTVTAWGFGQGMRVFTQLRSRAAIGGREELWPRADDALDVLVAFLEWDRDRIRARAGRQWKTSGLGWYNFDGASLLFRAGRDLSLEAYGGWSLARGLNEQRTSDALAAIEPFAPDARALLVGAQVSYRPLPGLGLGALYQREIRADRLGLYAERVAADAVYRRNRAFVSASLEADAAARQINDARLSVSVERGRHWTARAFARRYRPFFELWTIWGAFAPVGFTEAGAGASWRTTDRPAEVHFDLARRTWDDTDASTTFGTARSTGWNAGATGALRPSPAWLVQAGYRIDFGYGAARDQIDARVQRDLGDGAFLAASAIGFERQFEFRVAEGTVWGIGGDGRIRIGPRTHLAGSLMTYRHHGAGTAPDVDWSQTRGLLRLDWTLGPEPGLAPARDP